MKFNRKVVLISAAALLVGGGGFWVFAHNQNQATGTDQSTSGTTNNSAARANPADTTKTESTNTDNQAGANAETTTTKGSIIITSLSQDSTKLLVRTLVDGYISGTCTLSLSKSGQATIERTASVVFAPPSYYVCDGFDVAKSGLPVKGLWQVKVTVVKGTAKAESQTKEINVN